MLGRFLEVSLRAPRILDSWRWWQALGFASAAVGETWRHGYAVATDGRVAIGLHDGEVPQVALAYVRPELARRLAAFEAAGVEFDSRVLGDDRFNEATFTLPDGQVLRLLEARTWSPPAQATPSPLGWFVKPNRLGAKIGIWPDSRCETLDEALALSRRVHAAYRDAVVVQPYVPGRNVRASFLAVRPDAGEEALGLFFVDSGGDFQTMDDSMALYGESGAEAMAHGRYVEPELVPVVDSQPEAVHRIS